MNNNQSFTIITQNPGMRELLSVAGKLAMSDFSVLLIGETGTGKELFAEYIHRTSARWQRQMVKIGLMALPPDLMASELFGYEKGAFTSAVNSKKGLFEVANGGTLFLDDIDDVPLDIQAKLLRVLESHELLRVGGLHTIPVDVRLVAASKVDLKQLVNEKLFRADLFYRINVFPLQIPPLRDRKEDIPLLMSHFLNKFSPTGRKSISREAMDKLVMYSWPGNVRELRNIAQRLCFISDHVIDLEQLPNEVNQIGSVKINDDCQQCQIKQKMPYREAMLCFENQIVSQALKLASGNQSEAARILGLSLSTFRDRLRKLSESKADCSLEVN